MTYYFKTCLIVCLSFICVPSFSSSLEYAIIIDAGSSGSRAHVFAYDKASPVTPIPVINDLFSLSTEPGLSSYAPTGEGAGVSLKPILDAAVHALVMRGIDTSKVPISVLGTAGMRLLPLEQQQAIYKNVREYICAHDNLLLDDQNVRTITGKMEGVYDWLDVNYLLNHFMNASPTVGAIDMGGASTQIAFATTDLSKSEDELTFTLNNTSYRVFSRSFLSLGATQSIQTMNTDANAPHCYPTDFVFGAKTGDFHFLPCSTIYTSIIHDHQVSEAIAFTAGSHFVAFSAIYNVFKFFNILSTPTQSALQAQINAICYEHWATLQMNYPTTPSQFLAENCAKGVYFDQLLYGAYQLQSTQLTVTDQLNAQPIDWPLGALLYSLII